jgi:plasmid maintenance system antidote protein VapI
MKITNNNLNFFEKTNTDDIGALIDSFPVLSKATQNNNPLTLALYTAANSVAGKKSVTKQNITEIINSNLALKTAVANARFKTAFLEFLKAAMKLKPAGVKTLPGDSPSDDDKDDEEETDETSDERGALEVNVALLALLNDIPIAHPGDIITSEHHNSLRSAIRALASLIDETALTTTFTFAPNFLPAAFDQSQNGAQGRLPRKDEDDRDWMVLFNKAVVPTIGQLGGAGKTVKGGFIVSLPDEALIKTLIVRGKRLDENIEAQDPKSFHVTLFRTEPDKVGSVSAPIITIDLSAATGTFKKTEKSGSSVRVDNQKYLYHVSAVWIDEDDSAGFEIRSVQIICER